MQDEKIIYVSPEDDLTSVRERLEQIEERHIILIVQPPTQLKSHVGWRVIYTRMRERNKDVLVICTDRQIRAVAKAAGFRVAESQAAPISNRTRPASRPGLNPSSKPAARSRISTRGAPEGREGRVARQGVGRRRFSPGERPTPQISRESDSTLERTDKDESILGAGRGVHPSPSVFSTPPDMAFGHPIDFNIEASPSVQPAVPPQQEEEEFGDPLKTYYDQAQLIRKNAQEGQREAMTTPPESESEKQTFGGIETHESHFSTGAEDPVDIEADPYAYMDDQSFMSLPEQRASISGFDEGDAVAPDISDIPTDQVENAVISTGEIEDLGDIEAKEDLPEFSFAQSEEPVRAKPTPQRSPGNRTRNQRSGSLVRRSTSEPESKDEYLDRTTLVIPPSELRQASAQQYPRNPRQPRPSGTLPEAAANRAPQPVLQGESRSSALRTPAGQTRQRPRNARPIMPPPSSATRRPGTIPPASRPTKARNNRGMLIAIACLVLLALIATSLFYFVPTADVTISLPSKSYTLPVQLNATTNQHSTLPNQIRAQQLSFMPSASGQGNATGGTRVGNAPATGQVTFTNNGTQRIIVPSNTVIATPGGIQFLTTAEFLIPGQSTFPVNIVAQQPGDSGSVPGNSITVIPPASITKIAEASQLPSTAVNLKVTNRNRTQGGGATTVPAVTEKDLAGLTRTLHARLQKQIKTWLAQQLHSGDIRGKLIPDVLGNANPLPEEQLVGAPTAGQPATNGSFSGSLSLRVSVLVVRVADQQTAAHAQLQRSVQKLKPAFMLLQGTPVTLSNAHTTPSNDGTSLAIAVNASGQIIPIPALPLNATASGKGIDQAQSDVTKALTAALRAAGIQGKLTVTIKVSPSFLSLTPLLADHIHVNFKPLQRPSPQGVPNG